MNLKIVDNSGVKKPIMTYQFFTGVESVLYKEFRIDDVEKYELEEEDYCKEKYPRTLLNKIAEVLNTALSLRMIPITKDLEIELRNAIKEKMCNYWVRAVYFEKREANYVYAIVVLLDEKSFAEVVNDDGKVLLEINE